VKRTLGTGRPVVTGEVCFFSSVLAGEYVGLEEVSESCCSIAFGPLNLGYVDPATTRMSPSVSWRYTLSTPSRPSPIIPV
jgi:hypothetical protein